MNMDVVIMSPLPLQSFKLSGFAYILRTDWTRN